MSKHDIQHGRHQHEETDSLQASTRADPDSRSPYRRDNHLGVDDDEDTESPTEPIAKRATPKALWIAKTIMRREATVLCHTVSTRTTKRSPSRSRPSTSLASWSSHARAGKTIVVELAVLPMAHRYCERCGTMSVGGPLADRAFDELRELLEELCASARFVDYPENRLRKELSDALAKKGREDGPHDVTIVKGFVDNLLTA